MEKHHNTTTSTAQWWDNLLHSSGGTLELSKCFYYTFHWSFTPKGKAYLSPPSTFPHQISLVNSTTNNNTTIEHKACTQSHKTLGKMENPSRSQNKKTSSHYIEGTREQTTSMDAIFLTTSYNTRSRQITRRTTPSTHQQIYIVSDGSFKSPHGS